MACLVALEDVVSVVVELREVAGVAVDGEVVATDEQEGPLRPLSPVNVTTKSAMPELADTDAIEPPAKPPTYKRPEAVNLRFGGRPCGE